MDANDAEDVPGVTVAVPEGADITSFPLARERLDSLADFSGGFNADLSTAAAGEAWIDEVGPLLGTTVVILLEEGPLTRELTGVGLTRDTLIITGEDGPTSIGVSLPCLLRVR